MTTQEYVDMEMRQIAGSSQWFLGSWCVDWIIYVWERDIHYNISNTKHMLQVYSGVPTMALLGRILKKKYKERYYGWNRATLDLHCEYADI